MTPVLYNLYMKICRVIDKTCISPTTSLEQHIMWDDIANLSRYLLMLSFNNSLDVVRHLPYLFHIVTFIVCTGKSAVLVNKRNVTSKFKMVNRNLEQDVRQKKRKKIDNC